MFPFTAIATHDQLGQVFTVDGEWQDSTTGDWIGGLIGKPGSPPLPVGVYTLRTNTGDLVRIIITSTVLCQGDKRFQPFVGVGPPPGSDDETS
jgi:hypothetical protein